MSAPRLPDPGGHASVDALAERFYRFSSDVVNYVRGLPQLEMRTFSSAGHYPIHVLTDVEPVRGVVCVHAFVEQASEQTIAGAGVAWRASEDPEQPGIVVDKVVGVPEVVGTAGDPVIVTVLIVGEVRS